MWLSSVGYCRQPACAGIASQHGRLRPERAALSLRPAMILRAIPAGLILGLPAPAAARAPLGLLLLQLNRPWA